MVQHLTSLVLPLLPQLWEYFPEEYFPSVFTFPQTVFTFPQTACAPSTAASPAACRSSTTLQRMNQLASKQYGLYPVAALMKHSSEPTLRYGWDLDIFLKSFAAHCCSV
jgi:hypothetical protein